jgi:hypothetical protein
MWFSHEGNLTVAAFEQSEVASAFQTAVFGTSSG